MSIDRKKMIERVRKLLNLADKSRNNSVHEAEAAFKRAQKLIQKFGLRADEIEFEQDREFLALERFKKFEWNCGKSILFGWERIVASAVATATGTRVIFSRTYDRNLGKTVRVAVFVGHQNDGPVALAMMPAALDMARQAAKAYAKEHGFKVHTRLGKDFLLGFAQGLDDRAYADAQAHKKKAKTGGGSKALIVVDKAKQTSVAVKKFFPRLVNGPKLTMRYSGARSAGYKQGNTRTLGGNAVTGGSRRLKS
jgi:hypothetical protein